MTRPDTFRHSGHDFDLTHTFPKNLNAITKGRPDGVLVKVVLSCHCFTIKEGAIRGSPPDYQFELEKRWFCPERFEDSKKIHAHFAYALRLATTFNVNWSKDSNGNVNYLSVDQPEDGYRYCMYFDVDVCKDQSACEIFIIVRSAYRQNICIRNRERVRIGTLIDQALGIRQPGKRHKRRKK